MTTWAVLKAPRKQLSVAKNEFDTRTRTLGRLAAWRS